MAGVEREDGQYGPAVIHRPLVPLMNDTKWAELRLAMLEVEPRPTWSAVSRQTDVRCDPDSDWFYHFRIGSYSDLLLVDIGTPEPQQRAEVRAALRRIHLPAEETTGGFRVLGYALEGQAVGYI